MSHDCDVCNTDLAKEPWVELLRVSSGGGQAKGQFTHAKNPRVIEFTATLNGTELACRASAHDRWRAPRELLLSASPEGALLPIGQPDLLPYWLSRRYHRSAFPNEFNRRHEKVGRQIEKALVKKGVHITGLYIAVRHEELPESETYELVLRGTMRDSDFEKPELREIAQRGFGEIESALDGCEGLSVVDSELLPESLISLADLVLLRRWDPFEHVSFREEGTLAPRPR